VQDTPAAASSKPEQEDAYDVALEKDVGSAGTQENEGRRTESAVEVVSKEIGEVATSEEKPVLAQEDSGLNWMLSSSEKATEDISTVDLHAASVMTSQPEDVIEDFDVSPLSKASPADAGSSAAMPSDFSTSFAFKDDYEADFEDEELSKPQVTSLTETSRPAERVQAEASPSRLSDFQDIFDEPLLSSSCGNDETSDSGDFLPDVEDPMVEVEEEDSVPMFGDFDKDRLPTVNEIDEDEEGEANLEVQMDAKVPTFHVAEVQPGEASFSTFEPQRTPARVRPTSARVRRGQE